MASMGEVWMIASGKGGTGKSTLTSNLGVLFALGGSRTVLVDLDLGLRCLDLYLGVADRVLYDVMDEMEGYCRTGEALIRHPQVQQLYLLPAAQNRTQEDVAAERLKRLCAVLAEQFDVIILDLPPGIGHLLPCAAAAASKAAVVVCDDPVALRDAERAAGAILAGGSPQIGLVLNRSRENGNGKKGSRTEMIAETLGIPLWGIVPEDNEVLKSSTAGVPVAMTKTDSPAVKSYREIAAHFARRGN